MADVVDKATRSRMMSGIKGKDTTPEILVRSFLHQAGLRFRLHDRSLAGTPDLVLKKYSTVVFVHGCFWHQHANCPKATMPNSNKKFWRDKLLGNVARDERVCLALKTAGWNVKTVWECDLSDKLLVRLVKEIQRARGRPHGQT